MSTHSKTACSRQKNPRLFVNPDIISTRFRVWKREINQILPADLQLKDNLAGVVWALARKAQTSYPTGIPTGATHIPVRTSRPDLKRIGLMSCCEKTIYNQLIRLDNAGIITFDFRNNSCQGTRTVRNTHSAFCLLIPAWILCGKAGEQSVPADFLDQIRKKQNAPKNENFEGFGKKLPLLSYIPKNPNSINNAVDMWPAPEAEGNGPADHPPRQSRTENPEPSKDLGVKKAEPGQAPTAVTTRQPVATPEPKEPESAPDPKTVPGSPHQNTGRGGAGDRLKAKFYPQSPQQERISADTEAIRQLMGSFWEVAKRQLYPGQTFRPDREAGIQNLIWQSVYNKGVSKHHWTYNRWYVFQNQLLDRIDMVAQYVKRDPERFVVAPELYFALNNTTNGFAATFDWWVKRQVYHQQALAQRKLAQARRSIETGKPPKGNPVMGLLELYQYWRTKLAEHQNAQVMDAFHSFFHSYCITHQHADLAQCI